MSAEPNSGRTSSIKELSNKPRRTGICVTTDISMISSMIGTVQDGPRLSHHQPRRSSNEVVARLSHRMMGNAHSDPIRGPDRAPPTGLPLGMAVVLMMGTQMSMTWILTRSRTLMNKILTRSGKNISLPHTTRLQADEPLHK